MVFEESFLNQLKERVALSTFVSSKTRLVKKGQNYSGLCPFHQEKTPSFTVNDSKGYYHCFGCGAHGDVFSFLKETGAFSFTDAVKAVAEKAGLPLPHTQGKTSPARYDLLQEAQKWFSQCLKGAPLQYVKDREISAKSQEDFGLGWAPGGKDNLKKHLLSLGFKEKDLLEEGLVVQSQDGTTFDRFRERLMFPIFDRQGRPIGFGGRLLGEGQPKYLNSPETPLFSKGKVLYGYSHALSQKNLPVLLVEGYMDVIAVHQRGVGRPVAPLGTALTEDQLMALWRLDSSPYFCFDGDAAGRKAAIRALERAIPLLEPGHTLNFVFLPAGDDPDSLLRRGGRLDLNQAVSLKDVLWDYVTEGLNWAIPEQRALMRQKAKDIVKQIKNPHVSRSYEEVFAEYFSRKIKKKSYTPATPEILDRDRLQQKIILALLLNHPYLISEMEEKISSVSMKEQSFDQLKDYLLTCAAQSPMFVETKEALFHHLMEVGYKDVVHAVVSDDVYMHAPYVCSNADREVAMKGLQELLYRMVVFPSIEQELRNLQRDFQAHPSSDLWKKIQVLLAQVSV